MCSCWLRLLPLFIAALWLPLQAVAAIAMPFCRHGEAHKMVATEQIAAEHCHMQVPQAGTDDHALSCDNCEFCHLAAAGFMPTHEHVAAVIPADRDFRKDVLRPPASNIPEPPQQPPKRLA
jgi:hypothetical protein